MNPKSLKIHIFTDFDGTITIGDAHYAILHQFADPSWQKIEDLYLQGKIGSQEAIRQEFQQCEVSQSELDTFIQRKVKLDQSFHNFYRTISQMRIPLTIVSDGLDLIIQKILNQNDLPPLPIYANHLEWNKKKSLSQAKITFPCQRKTSYQYNPGRGLCGTCKTEIIHQIRTKPDNIYIILIGDGETDKCAAKYVDHVYPRNSSTLHHHCQQNNLPHTPFTSFDSILEDILSRVDTIS